MTREWLPEVDKMVQLVLEQAGQDPEWDRLTEEQRTNVRVIAWCHAASKHLWQELWEVIGLIDEDPHGIKIERYADTSIGGRLVFYFFVVCSKGYAFYSIVKAGEPVLHCMTDERGEKDEIGRAGYELLR